MRVALLAYGSRGDVQPFVALGQGLRAHGHTVVLAAPARFAPLATAHGLEFVGLPGDIDALSRGLADRAGNAPLAQFGLILRHGIALAVTVVEHLRAAVRQCDLIVHGFVTLGAGHVLAHELGVPDVAVQLFPFFVPYSTFPNPTLTGDFGPYGNRQSHLVSAFLFKWGSLLSYRWVQRRHPQIGPRTLPWPTPGRSIPLLLAYSPLLVGPTPRDYPLAQATGFWTMEPAPYQPDPDLAAFLAAGPAPIFASFGSMATQRGPGLTEAILGACADTGQRVILQRGWADLGTDHLPSWAFMVDELPHDWLLPRMAGIVHHGGAGTTAAALRSGVPSLAVPFTADQPFWGRRAHLHGVGPAPIPAPQLGRDNLKRALEVMDDPAIRRNAARFGAALRAETGVAVAIRSLEAVMR